MQHGLQLPCGVQHEQGMHMIRHDDPGEQVVAISLAEEKGCLDELAERWITQGAASVAFVHPLIDAAGEEAVILGLVLDAERRRVLRLPSAALEIEVAQKFLRDGIRHAKGDEVGGAGCSQCGSWFRVL